MQCIGIQYQTKPMYASLWVNNTHKAICRERSTLVIFLHKPFSFFSSPLSTFHELKSHPIQLKIPSSNIQSLLRVSLLFRTIEKSSWIQFPSLPTEARVTGWSIRLVKHCWNHDTHPSMCSILSSRIWHTVVISPLLLFFPCLNNLSHTAEIQSCLFTSTSFAQDFWAPHQLFTNFPPLS